MTECSVRGSLDSGDPKHVAKREGERTFDNGTSKLPMLKWAAFKVFRCVSVCFLFKYLHRLEVNLVEKRLHDFTTAMQTNATCLPEQRIERDAKKIPINVGKFDNGLVQSSKLLLTTSSKHSPKLQLKS